MRTVSTVTATLVVLALSAAGADAPTPDPTAERVVKLPAYQVVENPIAQVAVADNFASAVTTVDEAQLRDLNALDFTDALRRTPGVTISRYDQIGAFGGGEGGAVVGAVDADHHIAQFAQTGADRPNLEAQLPMLLECQRVGSLGRHSELS